MIDGDKIEVIQKVKPPQNVKELQRFVGQIKWHGRNLRYLADVMAPLSHLTKKDIDYVWGKI